MKTLRWLLITIVVVLSALIAVGFLLPGTTRVKAETVIALSPDRVFRFVAGFTDRHIWDPWFDGDSTIIVNYQIKEGFVGSTFSWQSEKAGKGEMKIDSVIIPEFVFTSVLFGGREPAFPVEWEFRNELGITRVSWSFTMTAASPFGRILNYFMSRSIAKSYKAGLASLKSHIEKQGVGLSTTGEPTLKMVKGFRALTVSGIASIDKISDTLSEYYGLLAEEIVKQGITQAGVPFAKYSDWNLQEGVVRITAGIPVTGKWAETEKVRGLIINDFWALSALHKGAYDEFGLTYQIMEEYAASKKIPVADIVWEFYLTDPQGEPDITRWETEIAFPITGK